MQNTKNRKDEEFITLSSAILERLATDYIEKTFKRQIESTAWVSDSDYGFAGFRIYFSTEIES